MFCESALLQAFLPAFVPDMRVRISPARFLSYQAWQCNKEKLPG